MASVDVVVPCYNYAHFLDRTGEAPSGPARRHSPTDAHQFDQRGYRHRVTIPLMDGHYRVRAVEKSQAQGPYDV
jgi:hypothetical protein